MHRFLLHNGQIHDASATLLGPGQVGLLGGWGVFSTIQVIEGILFAFERHWRRMQRDAKLLRVPFPERADELERSLLRLVEANQAWNSSLRVVVVRNRGGAWEGPGISRAYDLIALTADVTDWGRTVRLGVVPDARHAACRLAGTKMLSWSFNLVWYEEAHVRGFDEVILLNERGEVSECTSANIFISNGGAVRTPPLDSGCLPGVTRELLLSEIHAEGVDLGEQALTLADLEAADEVFITSTTRHLLPVDEVEGLRIRQRGFARAALERAFHAFVDDYVARHKTGAVRA